MVNDRARPGNTYLRQRTRLPARQITRKAVLPLRCPTALRPRLPRAWTPI